MAHSTAMNSERAGPGSVWPAIAIVSCIVAIALGGCRNSSLATGVTGTGPSEGSAGAPVRLLRPDKPGSGAPGSVRMALATKSIARAIKAYQTNKRKRPGGHEIVGADLNGDGKAEALVYFTGDDWCVKTGCTLAIFSLGPRGYRPFATIKRVQPAILVAPQATQGWRDLIASSGKGSIIARTVRLRFSTEGYPRNASVVPPIADPGPVRGETLFAAPADRVTPPATPAAPAATAPSPAGAPTGSF